MYREGQIIHGEYFGVKYRGVISHSRVKFGGSIRHVVELFDDITVFDTKRSSVLILESDNFAVEEDIALNNC